MLIVSSSEMLVKRESVSSLPIENSEPCSTKANESCTVHSILVKNFKIGTRNFDSL